MMAPLSSTRLPTFPNFHLLPPKICWIGFLVWARPLVVAVPVVVSGVGASEVVAVVGAVVVLAVAVGAARY